MFKWFSRLNERKEKSGLKGEKYSCESQLPSAAWPSAVFVVCEAYLTLTISVKSDV